MSDLMEFKPSKENKGKGLTVSSYCGKLYSVIKLES